MSIGFKSSASTALALSLACASASAGVIASSTFDSTDEGWMVGDFLTTTGSPSLPSFLASGGNPDGFIRTSDLFGYNAYLAPSAFLGNWSAQGASSLSFDLRVASSSQSNYATVVIEGGGFQISVFGPYPSSNNAWVPYTLDLTSASGWFYSNDGDVPGAAVSSADFATVLGNVQALRINADWLVGPGEDQTDLDNVTLNSRSTGTVPEPATLALLGLGLAALGGVRRRKLAA
jgi:type II secretory pathway pseudopilin PulG